MASGAINFRDIPHGPMLIDREGTGQRYHIFGVQITQHRLGVKGGKTLRRALAPVTESLTIVTECAIYAQRLRIMHHERVGPIGLFDRLGITTWQGRSTLIADFLIIQQKWRKWVGW